jgi:hypothetical protein
MKALFVQAANYSTKSFNAKLNFVFATAKRLSIKKSDALAMADGVENKSDEILDLAIFKAQFIEVATNSIKDAMINKIVTPTHKVKIAEVVAEVASEVAAVRPAKRDAKSPATKRKVAAAKKLVVVD